MRAVVQKVISSDVMVDGKVVGKINKGLTVLLGVEEGDTEIDSKYMAEKIINLRIFDDENDKLNLSLLDVKGEILAISQFTLLGDCRKGRRPNFTSAATPDDALNLYNKFIINCNNMGVNVQTGIFKSYMQVRINNDGPVTILVDSRKNF